MSIKEYLDGMKAIQANLLDFLDNESNTEENYQSLKQKIEDLQILDDKYKFKSILYLLIKIGNNHHRYSNLISKIEQILSFLKNKIKDYFSNWEIFIIFKKNKRLLLYLFEEQILHMDEDIANGIFNISCYKQNNIKKYFQPELASYKDKSQFSYDDDEKSVLPENFYNERKIGVNDNLICQLIQKDLVNDFIAYVNKNNISLTSTIKKSIYETNNLINQYGITLIEYAAFYGSINIFNYLRENGVKVTEYLFKYAIHSNNLKMIQLLEENCQYDKYEQLLKESIKCHHNDIAKYIINKYLSKEDYHQKTVDLGLKYYNFEFIQDNLVNENSFIILCRYDYYIIAHILLKNMKIDINKKDGYSALHYASRSNNIEIVKLLLNDPNTDVNDQTSYEGYTALHLASQKNNIEIVKLLLDIPNIDVNILTSDRFDYKCTALYLATENNNAEVVKLLLTNPNIDVNIQLKGDCGYNWGGYTPLHYASEKNNTEIVKLLLSYPNTDVNNQTNDGYWFTKGLTALHIATKEKNIEIVKLLLSAPNVDVNIQVSGFLDSPGPVPSEWEGCTALHFAAENNSIEIVKLLLSTQNIDVNIRTFDYIFNETCGYTPLHFAVEKNNIEVVKLLLSNPNIDVNIQTSIEKKDDPNKYTPSFGDFIKGSFFLGPSKKESSYYEYPGYTALHFAVIKNSIEVVKLLLKNKNIKTDLENNQGQKPIDLTKNPKIKSLLSGK